MDGNSMLALIRVECRLSDQTGRVIGCTVTHVSISWEKVDGLSI